jgi:hypothetical protein
MDPRHENTFKRVYVAGPGSIPLPVGRGNPSKRRGPPGIFQIEAIANAVERPYKEAVAAGCVS